MLTRVLASICSFLNSYSLFPSEFVPIPCVIKECNSRARYTARIELMSGSDNSFARLLPVCGKVEHIHEVERVEGIRPKLYSLDILRNLRDIRR